MRHKSCGIFHRQEENSGKCLDDFHNRSYMALIEKIKTERKKGNTHLTLPMLISIYFLSFPVRSLSLCLLKCLMDSSSYDSSDGSLLKCPQMYISRGNLGNIFVWPVILHVAIDKLSRCNSGHEGELCSKNRTSYNGRQKSCVCSRCIFASTLHPEQVQACWLRSELGTSSNCTNLNWKAIWAN